ATRCRSTCRREPEMRRTISLGLVGAMLLAAGAALLTLVGAATAGPRSTAAACGLPDSSPVWIEYADGTVGAAVRAEFARPGIVVTSSGTVVPRYFRAHGAATTYFVLHLPALVGDPTKPADPASVPGAAAALFDRAVASSGCPTPVIALNELL